MTLNQSGARAIPIWIGSVLVFLASLYYFPTIVEPSAAQLWKMPLGGIICLAFDQLVFWYARPSAKNPNPEWMARRSRIIAAGVIAGALIR